MAIDGYKDILNSGFESAELTITLEMHFIS